MYALYVCQCCFVGLEKWPSGEGYSYVHTHTHTRTQHTLTFFCGGEIRSGTSSHLYKRSDQNWDRHRSVFSALHQTTRTLDWLAGWDILWYQNSAWGDFRISPFGWRDKVWGKKKQFKILSCWENYIGKTFRVIDILCKPTSTLNHLQKMFAKSFSGKISIILHHSSKAQRHQQVSLITCQLHLIYKLYARFIRPVCVSVNVCECVCVCVSG